MVYIIYIVIITNTALEVTSEAAQGLFINALSTSHAELPSLFG